MRIGGYPSASASALAGMRSAEALMDDAAGQMATGEIDGFVDASVEMTQAKTTMGIVAALSRTQDQMMGSLLDILA
jgi:hypothetical protein